MRNPDRGPARERRRTTAGAAVTFPEPAAARYDAERTIDAFAAGLQGAIDLDSVRDGLVSVVHRALEPAHVSVWVRDRAYSWGISSKGCRGLPCLPATASPLILHSRGAWGFGG